VIILYRFPDKFPKVSRKLYYGYYCLVVKSIESVLIGEVKKIFLNILGSTNYRKVKIIKGPTEYNDLI
jgi:hypothetical protein